MMKLPKKNPIDLTIIIVNYNAKKFLLNCLESISQSDLGKYHVETIIIDSASTDDSFVLAQKSKYPHTNFIASTANIGFAAANNLGVNHLSSDSKYVLFLNPDTTVKPNTLAGMINYFDSHPHVDAATCNVILAITGKTQPECHRGFPTPNNSFWHFFGFGLPKLFPKTKLFNGYFMGYLDYSKPQIIDACVGAFVMVKKTVGDTIGWWSDHYFMYGEDLDFGFQLKKHGFKLFFIPDYQITHFQGISSGLNVSSVSKKVISQASRQTKIRSALATTQAMRIFYQRNLIKNYSPLWQFIIWRGIGLLEFYRVFKAKYL